MIFTYMYLGTLSLMHAATMICSSTFLFFSYAELAVEMPSQPQRQDEEFRDLKEMEAASLSWPKTVPDFESAGACYVDAHQLKVPAAWQCGFVILLARPTRASS